MSLLPEVEDYKKFVEKERAPLGLDIARGMADYLDEIIDTPVHGRTATCDAEKIEQRFRIGGLVLGPRAENSFASVWFELKHTIFADRELGEVYDMLLDWRAARGDLDENGFARSYHLSLGRDDRVDSRLMYRYFQGLIGNHLGQLAEVDTVLSNYFEVDEWLAKAFYQEAPAGEYEAGRLFDELGSVATLASIQSSRSYDVMISV